MPDRLLRNSILTSENFDSLSCGAESMFYRLLLICDDYGRFEADERVLLARCYPLKVGELARSEITSRLSELVKAGILQLYACEGKPYGAFAKWTAHNKVRAKYSKHPEPPCQHVSADVDTCEQMLVYTESESESESDNPPLIPPVGEDPKTEDTAPKAPPWWTGEKIDPLVCEAVAAYLQVPRFAKTTPNQGRFERLIADQRTRAPNDDAIRYEFEGFVGYYLSSKKFTDGVATMRNWFGNKHERWHSMKSRNGKGNLSVAGAETDRRQPAEGVDYRLKGVGNGCMPVDIQTGEPFDGKAWFESRNLHPVGRWAS